MDNALSTIRLLPATKKELKTYKEKVKTEVLSGQYNALEVAGMLKAMEELTKALRSDGEIKTAIQEEAGKYPEKTIDYGNFKITKADRRKKDFSGIDPVYDEMVRERASLDAQIKAREAVIESGVDPATGETFPPVPFETISVISVSLK